jgi:hypothetical protein
MKIHPVGAEFFREDSRTDGRTDRQTDRQTDRHEKVKMHFSQFLRTCLKLHFTQLRFYEHIFKNYT